MLILVEIWPALILILLCLCFFLCGLRYKIGHHAMDPINFSARSISCCRYSFLPVTEIFLVEYSKLTWFIGLSIVLSSLWSIKPKPKLCIKQMYFRFLGVEDYQLHESAQRTIIWNVGKVSLTAPRSVGSARKQSLICSVTATSHR